MARAYSVRRFVQSRAMPDWLVWIPRALGWLVHPYRLLRRRFADREVLRREGAQVVTPIIETVEAAGPAAVVMGSAEEIRERMHERETAWVEQRRALLTYANYHPSDGDPSDSPRNGRGR
jgi:hypothetical protein